LWRYEHPSEKIQTFATVKGVEVVDRDLLKLDLAHKVTKHFVKLGTDAGSKGCNRVPSKSRNYQDSAEERIYTTTTLYNSLADSRLMSWRQQTHLVNEVNSHSY